MDRPRSPRLGWLPPLLVGASAAVAAEVAVSVLLYGGPGLLRSLTTILTIEGLAFAGGLATAPRTDPGLVDRLRRQWLFCLVGFLAAALYGTTWSLLPWLGTGRLGQGIGLAVLGALPLYTSGAVLGGMAGAAHTDVEGRLRWPGPPAAMGAALGFVLTGLLLPRAPMPASLLIACLVMLSLGGMVYGAVLAARTEVEEIARRESRGREVRVEERRRPLDEVAHRALIEGTTLRRSVDLDRQPHTPWDVALVRASMPNLDDPWSVLFVGGGVSSAPHAVLREHPTARVHVLEQVPAVIELGRDHFDTRLTIGSDERIAVAVGELSDQVVQLDTLYDLVVIDGDAIATLGGLRSIPDSTRARIFECVAPGGVLAVGAGSKPSHGPDAGVVPDGWTSFVVEPAEADPRPLALWIARRSNDPVPGSLEGFALRELEQPRAETTAP